MLIKRGEIIREISTLNKNIAGRTRKEFYEQNKEKLLEKRKELYVQREREREREREEVNKYVISYNLDIFIFCRFFHRKV